jgi:hypothetical protein
MKVKFLKTKSYYIFHYLLLLTYDENLANLKVYFIQNLVNFGLFSMKNPLNRSKSYLSIRNLAKFCKYKKHTKKITQLLSLQFHKAQESIVNTQIFFHQDTGCNNQE